MSQSMKVMSFSPEGLSASTAAATLAESPALDGGSIPKQTADAALRSKAAMMAPIFHQASLQLHSRELSKEASSKSSQLAATSAPASHSNPASRPSSTPTMFTPFPRVDHSISWADLEDSDTESGSGEEAVHPKPVTHPRRSLIPSFSGYAQERAPVSEAGGQSSIEDSPTPLATPQPPPARTPSPDEPVQTHFGFNLMSLGAVPEEAELVSFLGHAAAAADDLADHRVSVVISGDGGGCCNALTVPRQRGYAGVLTMLHRSKSEELADAASVGPGVMSARIEAVLPVGQDEKVKQMVHRAMHGFLAQQEPSAPREGMGGTYFLSDETGIKVGIFKPCDEEPLAPNNPKGWAGRAMGAPGMKPSVRVGEAALREVAAYLLDHGGFAGVPPAALVLCRHSALNYKEKMPKIESLMDISAMERCTSDLSCATPEPAAAWRTGSSMGGLTRALSRCALSDPAPVAAAAAAGDEDTPLRVSKHLSGPALPGGYKLGSFQAFASHVSDANELAPSHFSADNVHRIGILDIRLLNCDRHAGNLLVADPPLAVSAGGNEAPQSLPHDALQRLVPIDHGYALPEALEDPYFEWQYWPQTSVPFSAEAREYVAALDAHADIALLQQRLPALRVECLRCLEATTLVLKECTAAGLTLFEIASVFSRPSEQVPSDFEVMCIDARTDALTCLASGRAPTLSAGTGTSSTDSIDHYTAVSNPSPPPPATFAEETSPSSSLEMSGLLSRPGDYAYSNGSAGVTEEGALEDVDIVAVNGRCGGRTCSEEGSDEHASPLSPCIAAAEGSAPRPILSTWQRMTGVAAVTDDGPMSPPSVFRTPLAAPNALGSLPALGEDVRSELLPAVFSERCGIADVPMPPGSMMHMHSASGLGVHSRRQLRRSAWASKRGVRGGGAPLVCGAHPQKAKYVFTGISEEQWPVFVERMGDYVADELSKGTWRVGRESCPMAGSCPQPFKQNLF